MKRKLIFIALGGGKKFKQYKRGEFGHTANEKQLYWDEHVMNKNVFTNLS